MTTRTKLLGMCDVIMRVPPLFIIDEILKISSTAFSASSNLLSSPSEGQLDPLSVNGSHLQPSDPGYIDDDLRFYNVAANTLKFLACSFGELVPFWPRPDSGPTLVCHFSPNHLLLLQAASPPLACSCCGPAT